MNWVLFGQIIGLAVIVCLIVNAFLNNAKTHAVREEMKLEERRYELDRQFFKETGQIRG